MGEVIPIFRASGSLSERSESKGPSEEPAIFSSIEEASLRALGRRALSRREVERTLAQQGFHDHAIADELDRLESVGLVDDDALAQHIVVRLQEQKGMTGSAIKAALVGRLIAPRAIAYAIDLVDTGDELAQARELAAKRARQYSALDRVVAERRLSAYLLRRGFAPSAVRTAVAEALRTA